LPRHSMRANARCLHLCSLTRACKNPSFIGPVPKPDSKQAKKRDAGPSSCVDHAFCVAEKLFQPACSIVKMDHKKKMPQTTCSTCTLTLLRMHCCQSFDLRCLHKSSAGMSPVSWLARLWKTLWLAPVSLVVLLSATCAVAFCRLFLSSPSQTRIGSKSCMICKSVVKDLAVQKMQQMSSSMVIWTHTTNMSKTERIIGFSKHGLTQKMHPSKIGSMQ
jgi:hypothetical protein